MVSVKGSIKNNRYKTELNTIVNQLIADEPKENGGEETGFSPSELLAGALTACTCVTLRMYADKKGWPLLDVKVQVDFDRDIAGNISTFNRTIELIGELTTEQKERLLEIATKCFIHKTLTNPIQINTSHK